MVKSFSPENLWNCG